MINERLKQLRKLKKITQLELAKEMNVAKTTIASYEQGVSEPSIAMMTKLAKYFNVSPSYLMGWDSIQPNSSGQTMLFDDLLSIPVYESEKHLIESFRNLTFEDQNSICEILYLYPQLDNESKNQLLSLLNCFSKQSSKIASLERKYKNLTENSL